MYLYIGLLVTTAIATFLIRKINKATTAITPVVPSEPTFKRRIHKINEFQYVVIDNKKNVYEYFNFTEIRSEDPDHIVLGEPCPLEQFELEHRKDEEQIAREREEYFMSRIY